MSLATEAGMIKRESLLSLEAYARERGANAINGSLWDSIPGLYATVLLEWAAAGRSEDAAGVTQTTAGPGAERVRRRGGHRPRTPLRGTGRRTGRWLRSSGPGIRGASRLRRALPPRRRGA